MKPQRMIKNQNITKTEKMKKTRRTKKRKKQLPKKMKDTIKEKIISSDLVGLSQQLMILRLSKLLICCERHSHRDIHKHEHTHTMRAYKNNLKKNVSPVRFVSSCMPQSGRKFQRVPTTTLRNRDRMYMYEEFQHIGFFSQQNTTSAGTFRCGCLGRRGSGDHKNCQGGEDETVQPLISKRNDA